MNSPCISSGNLCGSLLPVSSGLPCTTLISRTPARIPCTSKESGGRTASRRKSGRPSRANRNMRVSAHSRSEEHTSELQSRLHLVCRLLLEKKKKLTLTPPAVREMGEAFRPPRVPHQADIVLSLVAAQPYRLGPRAPSRDDEPCLPDAQLIDTAPSAARTHAHCATQSSAVRHPRPTRPQANAEPSSSTPLSLSAMRLF